MIIAPTPAFYVLNAQDDAAEIIAALVSTASMSDIVGITVVSKEFTNDIEPLNELDETVETIKLGLDGELEATEEYNPLYIPQPIELLDEALVIEQRSDNVQFSAMNGNPYAVKIVEVTANEKPMVSAFVTHKPFDLPGYETIMEKQHTPLH